MAGVGTGNSDVGQDEVALEVVDAGRTTDGTTATESDALATQSTRTTEGLASAVETGHGLTMDVQKTSR